MKGSDTLYDTVKDAGLPITADMQEARCIVMETSVEHLPEDRPVFVLLKGMITYRHWKMLNRTNIKTADNKDGLLELLNSFMCSITIPPQNSTVHEMPAIQEKQQPATINRQNNRPTVARSGNDSLIIASFSTAGGAGKTFWATNLGAYLALSGTNTVIADFDFGFGDVASAMGVTPKGDYATVADWCNLNGPLKEYLLIHPSSGVYLLPCSKEEDIPKKEAEDILVSLAQLFDVVIVDLGVNPFAPHSRAALTISDKVFIIGGQDVKTIEKVSRFTRQETGKLQIADMRFIVNKVTPTGYYKPREVAKQLGFSEYHEIPLDEKSANAAARSKKVVVQMNGSPAGESVKAIAGSVFNTVNGPQNVRRSLLGSIKALFRR